MPKIIELRQNRNHIRSNFDGYKLSLESVPVHKQELASTSPPYHAAPNEEQYSLLHAELFSIQNLLQSDPWIRTHAYYINCLGQIVKIVYNDNSGMPHPMQIVFQLSAQCFAERQRGDYNYSLRFISEKYCLLCDGIQSLTLFDTGDRELRCNEWKIVMKCCISDHKLKPEENRNFLILDSRLDILQEQKQISIALAHIQRINEVQQNGAFSSTASSSSHFMYIHWCKLSLINNTWEFAILDTLEGKGLIYYCAFEPRGESLIVCTNRDMLWRSVNKVKQDPTKTTLLNKPQLHMEPINSDEVEIPNLTWSQTEDDLTIKFSIMLNTDKNDYTVKCDNKWMKVKCNEEILLDQELYEKIDHDLTTWTIENNFIQINLMKQDSNKHWPQLLAHATRPKEEVENKAAGDAISMEQKPIANLDAPIEECDFPLYSVEDDISMHRFHMPTHTITHSILFGNTPPIFTTSLRPGYPAAFATRQDVDACLWLQHYQPQKTDDNIWSLRHEGNLHAFGYIQASKQQKKFIDCSPDLNYSLICESHRHIFLYKSKYETADGLRNRNGPQISLVMGLLSEGSPLSWEETKALAEHVREHGIQQFINLYHRLKDRQGDILKWGDEVEYIIVKFDDKNKVARVSLKAQTLLAKLNEKEAANPQAVKSLWRPEYGAYMIEGTPGKPFGGLMAHFNVVEANMRYRREEVTELLDKDECVMSITNFPRLGCKDFTYPIYKPCPDDVTSAARSLYFPDEAIYPGHPRFKTLTRNIRMRRGEKVAIKLKVFKDEKTVLPIEGSPPNEPDIVLLDAMGFGMGCCCLQLTFQACNITEARTLYDHLAPLCPIMLALTAASPIYRGYLTESDCRWNVISSSVDCRTPEERGLKPLKGNTLRIAKSRYDSIDLFLSPESEKYNDVPVVYDEKIYQRLLDGGIDNLLAQHVAHLFIRDTVSLFSEKVHQNDAEDSDHFENIQSTNWQTMRFKPPPPNSSIGWRVEFRPCEAQISDFENAAVVCFIVLLTRVILSYQLNFLVPISKVDENMQTAQKRDACRTERFWFRKNVRKAVNGYRNGEMSGGGSINNNVKISHSNNHETTNLDKMNLKTKLHIKDDYNNYKDQHQQLNRDAEDCEYELMTIGEIFNGKPDTFPGLIPLIRSYLQSMEVDTDTHCTIEQYLHFIQKRASGEILTTASWLREQVLNHPDYKKDSIVSDAINYDILKRIEQIQQGKLNEPTLLGECHRTKTKDFIPPAIQKHLNGCCEMK